MKLEKRSGGGPAELEEEAVPRGKKPVVVYIMVLFIAAFLLMAWSFASHQRSNTEALGRLQSSVTAMQEVQDLQDQIIALQKELAEAEKRVEELEDEAESRQSEQETKERELEAMDLLYSLQQRYSAKDYTACREILDRMESGGLTEALRDGQPTPDSVTAPRRRFQQLKAAVEAREAEAEEAEQ